ncbi:MAG: mannose-1-phosphate guanylyltransferase, partial [Geodermatophilaceae bacterium]|nr:mannose-1-phosphate guanylyltransferase [Geodermatophilaceae bacterium]
AAAADGRLVTIGITPTRPETGYGYIRATAGDSPVRPVTAFREKPDRSTALAYVAAGDYLWNAAMFVWRADVFLAEVRRQLPTLYDGVTAIAAALHGADRHAGALLAEVWPTLPRISVDVGVIEGSAAAGLVSCVPASLGWTDVGDWDTLGSLLEHGTGGTGSVTVIDSEGCVVWGDGRQVVLLGVSDLVVADAGDALLVCPRSRAQEVGGIVAALRAAGRHDLT